MMVRLDALEHKGSIVEERMDKLDATIETMGTSMSAQFSQVMQGIAELAKMQKHEEPRKKQALQPFSAGS